MLASLGNFDRIALSLKFWPYRNSYKSKFSVYLMPLFSNNYINFAFKALDCSDVKSPSKANTVEIMRLSPISLESVWLVLSIMLVHLPWNSSLISLMTLAFAISDPDLSCSDFWAWVDEMFLSSFFLNSSRVLSHLSFFRLNSKTN
jgi:hypothetical protein